MLETIKQLESMARKLLSFKNVLAIRLDNCDFEVQVSGVEIITTLAKANKSKVEIEKRDSDDFPWEVFTKIGEIKVLTIIEHEELVQYAKENLINTNNLKEKCLSDVGASAEADSEMLLNLT